MPRDLSSMPVLITLPSNNGTYFGTGIYFELSNKLFLVTAEHCIFDMSSTNASKLISSNAWLSSHVSTNENLRLTNLVALNLEHLQRAGRIKRHPSHDVVVIYFANTILPFVDVNDVRLYLSGRVVDWNSESCVSFTNVPNGNETLILGYPLELLKPAMQWLTSALETQVDFNYPLIRRGIISQKNQKTGKLIIDSGVYGGNSGGPVVIVQHPSMDVTTFKIVGIITEFVPTETRVNPQIGVTNSILVNSGYSVVESIDYALDLMGQF